ncbi:MAG TPA: alanine--tRNA ligase [Gammaproteobacteria bacterium]
MKSSNELRRAFIDYFVDNGHEEVASSSLVPINDPTLLFTNAGMVQFKDVFLGAESREVPRAVTAQRCVRAGGKHNDLENVGYTSRHHTFFEMLGNFSFGDYFKQEAIGYAWKFVTEVLGLPPEKLWCTVFTDDDEAASIWIDEIGIDPGRFTRLGESENFWAMGETGPCGPCSEIFYDHGAHVPGGPPGSPEAEGDRYVEIWNLVFMQYDRNEFGELTPLPKPSVDTGMGLERLAAVMQGVHSNYEIDLFAALIAAAAEATATEDLQSKSLRVIADHIRACSFLIADGVLPSNEGRGYVLRRIIRRAIRHGYKLGMEDPFFHMLVSSVETTMGDAYPTLGKKRSHVERVLLQEEQRFAETLSQGMRLLEDATGKLGKGGTIPGETAFKLYDTYGFPEDLTADYAREHGFSVDRAGFEAAMSVQRNKAKKASRFKAGGDHAPRLEEATDFLGYEQSVADSKVHALFNESGDAVDSLASGESGTVVLEATPFYAESGGQVGDTGTLSAAGVRFEVEDTQKLGSAFGHMGRVVEGSLAVGDELHAAIDSGRRAAIVLNHSATHLMHAALRTVLGDHVQQKGSLVAPDRLRFDFAHYEPVMPTELEQIETLVNDQIRANASAETRVLPYEDAIAAGALAFFGEKYGDDVRVLRIGDFSTELCGGTHVGRAGDIGFFKITSESGIAAGVRRIEAVTGSGALAWVRDSDRTLREAAALIKGTRDELPVKLGQLTERTRQLEREIAELKARLATGSGRDLLDDVKTVAGVKLLVARIDGADAKSLRASTDKLKDKLGSGIVVLGGVEGDKVRLVAGVTSDLTDRFRAGDIIKPIAAEVGGSGGGRPDFAQAGGTRPEALDGALGLVETTLAAADA